MFSSHFCNLPVLQMIKYGPATPKDKSAPSLRNVTILSFKYEISQNEFLRAKCKTRCFKHFENRSKLKTMNSELFSVRLETLELKIAVPHSKKYFVKFHTSDTTYLTLHYRHACTHTHIYPSIPKERMNKQTHE